METEDIYLGKAKLEDWEPMYRNIWSRPQAAEYMAWKVTADQEEARERMKRTVIWQETHDTWLVYEKESGQAVGFAGLEEVQPGIYQDTGIALGPEYVGRGYGRQVLRLFPRAMSQAAVLARTVGECREGQKPRSKLWGF